MGPSAVPGDEISVTRRRFVRHDTRSPEPDFRRGAPLGSRTNESLERLDFQAFAEMCGSVVATGPRGSGRLCSRRMRGRRSIHPIRVCRDVDAGSHGAARADG
jgi:hypothetical protein